MRAQIVAALLLSACAAQTPASVSDPLTGSAWTLITESTLAPSIDFTERGASGSTGCNHWFSAARRSGQTLSFGNIATTRRACPEQQMQGERMFIEALNATQSTHIEGDQLALLDANGVELLRFQRAD